MANQNFRVKKGLEVGLGATFLYADESGVGINSTAPRRNLDVRGNATIDELEVGVDTTTQAITVTGLSTFNGNMLVDGDVRITGDLEFDDAFIDEIRFNVGIGSTLTVDELIVNESAEINGAGIATIGGDPEFNSISVATTSFFGGIATFQSDVTIGGTVTVGGDIVLEDLEAGNISVGGTVFTDGLNFNVGVGTSLRLKELTVDEAGIGTAGIGSLTVTGVSSFVGFATFGGDVAVAGTITVSGDIVLDDLESGSIKTNQIEFNVGIGTSLYISGISSLQTITGFGSELTYLPAGSISTTVGIASTIPPTLRPTGEPVQVGDLWFDSLSLRQFTYFDDGDSKQWVDSNPPPIQPNLRVKGQYGSESLVDLDTQPLGIEGINDQVITVAGFGNTIRVGLETNVVIGGNLQIGPAGVLTVFDAFINGVAEINEANIGIASIANINVSGIDVDNLTADSVVVKDLEFGVGVGSTLSLVDLNVSGIASINNAGIATLGGNANFDFLQANNAQLGPSTITQALRVTGTLEVTSDSTFRDIDVRHINSSGVSTLPQVGFDTAVGTGLSVTTLDVSANINAGTAEAEVNTLRVNNTLFVSNEATFTGLTSVRNNFNVRDTLTVFGNANLNGITQADNFSSRLVNVTQNLGFTTGSGTDLTMLRAGVTSEFDFAVGVGSTLTVNNELNVPGITSLTGDFQFTTGVGHSLRVSGLEVTDAASIPGIPIQGGAAEFSELSVTGPSTFTGIATFYDDVEIKGDLTIDGTQTYANLTGENINVTGIGTVVNLVSTAATIGVASIASGVATAFYVENLSAGVATVTTAALGIATVNDITVYNTIIDSTENVGVAGSVLTIDAATGKLIWNSPEGAGISTDFAPGNTFYVSPNGSNANPGDAPTRPWASVAYALGQIAPSTNDTLIITAGIYEETFPVGGIEVPAGLTIKGAGQRATIIKPTTVTRTNDGFRLNDSTTIEDITIEGFLKPTVGDSNYAFQLSETADIQTKSPYLSRITVVNKGSTAGTDPKDPYGFQSAQGGGGGIKIDGSLVTPTSIEAAILINEVTLFVPNNVGLEMTGGARAEMVNSFIYFASEAVRGEANLTTAGGFAGNGQTRLAFNNAQGNLPSTGNVRYFSPNGDILAEGTIVSADTDQYVFLDGPGTGYFEPPSRRAAKTVSFIVPAELSTTETPPLTDRLGDFATTSLDVTGVGAACNVELNADFGFGTGDFTIQVWVYFPANAYGTDIIDFRDNLSTDRALTLSKAPADDRYEVKIGGVSVLQSNVSSAVINDWQQVAVSRESGTLRIYVDGVLENSVANSDDLGTAKPLEIGADFDATNGFGGYLSDLKIDKGADTRRGNYTLPTEFLKGDIYTVLLADFNGTAGSTIQPDDIIIFQDIVFVDAPAYEVDSIRLGDYSQFGADLRSVSSAFQYGAKGVVANGQGVTLRLIAANFNYIGAGGDISNDSVSNHAIEVIPTSNGKVSYVSVDQQGDFRVGDSFFVNQDTGEVSFTADVVDLTSLSSLTISDGANASVITPTSGRFGNVVISGNTVESVTGDLTLRPGGAGEVTIEGNTNIVGILTAQIIEINSIQNGTTAIALDQDSDIRINVSGPEVARFTVGGLGIGTDVPRANVDVIGQTQLEDLEVTGIATVGLLSATEVQTGLITSQQGVFQNIVVVGIATLGAGGTEGGGTTIIDGNTVITGIVTIGENSTTISGIENEEFVRAGSTTADFAQMQAGNGADTRSNFQAKDFFGERANFTGVTTVGVLSVTGNANVAGSINISGDIDLTGGALEVDSIDVQNLDVSGVSTLSTLYVSGVSSVGFLTATSLGVGAGLTVHGHTELDTINAGVTTVGFLSTTQAEITTLTSTDVTSISLIAQTADVQVQLEGADANFSGIVTTNTLVANEIIFDGGSGIGSDFIETQFLDVSGVTTTANLNVTTGIGTIGILSATNGNVSAGLTVFDLTVLGTANIEGSGISTQGGDATFNSLGVAQTSNFGGVATFEDQVRINAPGIGLTVNSSAYFAINVTAGSDVIALGDLQGQSAIVDNVNADFGTIAALGVTTDLGVGRTAFIQAGILTSLTVSDFADIDKLNAGVGTVGVLSATNADIVTLTSDDVTVSTSLEVTGDTTVGFITASDVAVSGAATVYGSLTVEGDLDLTGDITLDEIDAENLAVAGVATIGTLGVTTDLSVGRHFEVSGISTVGFLSATDVNVVSNVTVGSSVTAAELFATNKAEAPQLISESLSVTGVGTIENLVATASTVGVLSASNTVVDGTLDVLGETTVGFITATGVSVGSALTVYGDLDVSGGIDLSGDIEVEDLTARNVNVSGIISATAGIITSFGAENLSAGIITATRTDVGIASVGFLTATNAAVGAALTVYEDLTVFGDLNVTGDISYDEVTGRNLNITGVGTIANFVSTASTIGVLSATSAVIDTLASDLIDAVGVDAEGVQAGLLTATTAGISSAAIDFANITDAEVGIATVGFLTATNATVGAALTVVGDLTVEGNFDLTGDIVLDEIDARSLNVSGVGTIENLVSTASTVGVLSATTAVIDDLEAPKATVGFVTAKHGYVGVLTAIRIEADVVIGGGTTISQERIVVENLDVTGIATIQTADLKTTTVESLEVTGVSTVGFITAISGNIQNDLFVGGNLNVQGDITYDEVLGRNINISGVGTITNLVATASTVGVLSASDTVIDGTLGVTGDATFDQSLTVLGDLNVTGDISYDEVTGRNLNITGIGTIENLVSTASTTDSLTVNNDVDVTGTATIGILTAPAGTIDLLDFTTATGGTVDADTVEATNLTVDDTATVGFITAQQGFVGLLTATNITANSITIDGASIGGDNIVVPFLSVTGVATITSGIVTNLEASGIATFLAGINVNGNVSGDAGITTTGDLTDGAFDLVVDSVSVGSTLSVGSTATFSGVGTGLEVINDAFIGGNLKVEGNLDLTGDITLDEIDAENLNIAGVATVAQLEVTESADIGIVSISTTGIITATSGVVTYYGDGVRLDTLPQSFTSPTEPTERQNGQPLKIGDLWFNSATSGVGTYRQYTYTGTEFVVSGSGELEYSTNQGSETIDLSTESLAVFGQKNINTRLNGKEIIVELNDDVSIVGVLTAQDIDTLSDQRYKENITPIEGALDKVSQLNGVEFNWKKDGRSAGGVIAQDVEAVFPNLVSGEDPLTVNYNGIIGALVEAVKELKAENENLRNRIEKLEN